MRRSRPPSRQLLAEISATPLLDLVFILLFAFMVALPLVSRSDALLQPAEAPQRLSQQTPDRVLVLQASGPDQLVHEGTPLTAIEVEQRLQTEWLPADPDLGVRIEIAPDQPVATLTQVMALLARAGVQRASVRAEPGSP